MNLFKKNIPTLFIMFFIGVTTNKFYSQNVGIGNNNPQSKLHVTGAIRSDTLIYTSTGTVRNVFATPNGRIYDSLVALSPAWLINGNSNIGTTNFLGTLNANDLIFRTNNTEKARITSLGNLGIGTNAPSRLLHVFGTGVNNVAQLESNTPFTFLTLKALGDLSLNGIASAGNDNISIVTNAMERVRVNLNGNVGIGTLAPNNRLEITSVSANTSGLRFTNLTSASPTIIANGKALTVDVNGDVILVPAAAASNDWALLGNAGTNPTINFLGTTDNNDLVFRANNLEHARITTVGVFHNMQGAFVNTIGSDGQGANSNAGGGASLFWRLNNGGYAGSFYNQSLLPNADGLMVKILATSANNTIFDASTGTQGVAGLPVLTAKGNGFVGVGTNVPRAKFDVLNGDAYVADNVFPFGSFNVGRSATFIVSDNLKPYTDNGLRVYDNNSNSHINFDANSVGVIQFYTPAGSTPPALENPATTGVLSINPFGGNVGVGTTAPQAYLDVVSTTNGFAMPRMTSVQRKAIAAPTIGVQVYDTDLKGFYYWDGTKWDCANNPAGTVQYFANTTPPNGYLECNGAAVSRTTYAELFNAIGTIYGAGNGTTTFNLPDLRGEFIRGYDNGKGSDPARVIGTFQSPSPLVHDDTFGGPAQDTDFSMDYAAAGLSDAWPTATVGSIPSAYWGRGNAASPVGNWVVYSGASAQGMISGSRPRNVALMPCIKY